MNTRVFATILMIALLPSALLAAPTYKTKTKNAAFIATVYECSVCHMQFSAADAKKDHYKDQMDGGKLIPLKPVTKAASPIAPREHDKTHSSETSIMPGMKM